MSKATHQEGSTSDHPEKQSEKQGSSKPATEQPPVENDPPGKGEEKGHDEKVDNGPVADRPTVPENKPAGKAVTTGTYDDLKHKLSKGGKLTRKAWDKKDYIAIEDGIVYRVNEEGKQSFNMRGADAAATDWTSHS